MHPKLKNEFSTELGQTPENFYLLYFVADLVLVYVLPPPPQVASLFASYILGYLGPAKMQSILVTHMVQCTFFSTSPTAIRQLARVLRVFLFPLGFCLCLPT